MARFFLQGNTASREVGIVGDDARHIARVLRMRPGEQIEVVLSGQAYAARLLEVSPEVVRAELGTRLQDSESPLVIHLYQGLPKGDKLDLIIQKAVELGVQEITPLITSRVVVKLRDLSGGQKLLRWQKIAAEAAKQSRRTIVPAVRQPISLSELPQSANNLRLVAWERETRQLSDVLRNCQATAVDVVIGPEGGLAEEEVASLENMGFCSVGLGPRILRTETAPLALLSILQYHLGDLGGGHRA